MPSSFGPSSFSPLLFLKALRVDYRSGKETQPVRRTTLKVVKPYFDQSENVKICRSHTKYSTRSYYYCRFNLIFCINTCSCEIDKTCILSVYLSHMSPPGISSKLLSAVEVHLHCSRPILRSFLSSIYRFYLMVFILYSVSHSNSLEFIAGWPPAPLLHILALPTFRYLSFQYYYRGALPIKNT